MVLPFSLLLKFHFNDGKPRIGSPNKIIQNTANGMRGQWAICIWNAPVTITTVIEICALFICVRHEFKHFFLTLLLLLKIFQLIYFRLQFTNHKLPTANKIVRIAIKFPATANFGSFILFCWTSCCGLQRNFS